MIRVSPMKERGRKGLYTIQVFSDGAGTGYVDLSHFQRPGQVNFGLLLQAHGTSVIPSVTLAPITTSQDNSSIVPASVPWKAYSSLADGDLVNLVGILGSGLRLQFSGAGSIFVAVL